MQINHEAGVLYDAIAYTSNYFNMDNVKAYHKTFVKNEDDIFDNFYEFRKFLGVEPSESLYLFFIFNPHNPNVILQYLIKIFPNFNFSAEALIREIQNKTKFKKFMYRYILEPFKNELYIEDVIKGDNESISTAIALLSSQYAGFPLHVKALFFKFEELVDELVTYLKFVIQKVAFYHKKKKDAHQEVVLAFLNSERAKEHRKQLFFNDKVNLDKYSYAISFFRSFVVSAPEDKYINSKTTLVIGDKCFSVTGVYSIYSHITDTNAATLITVQIKRDIINALIEKGEKSVLQLSEITPHDKGNITKYMKILRDESVVRTSRKESNEFFYQINYDYLKFAKAKVVDAFDEMINKEK